MRLLERIFWYCLSSIFFEKFDLKLDRHFFKWGDVLRHQTGVKVVVMKKLKEDGAYSVGIVPW